MFVLLVLLSQTLTSTSPNQGKTWSTPTYQPSRFCPSCSFQFSDNQIWFELSSFYFWQWSQSSLSSLGWEGSLPSTGCWQMMNIRQTSGCGHWIYYRQVGMSCHSQRRRERHTEETFHCADGLTPLHTPTDHERENQRPLMILSVPLHAWSACNTVHHMQPQGKKLSCSTCLITVGFWAWGFAFRSAAALMHSHAKRNESGLCAWLSKGQEVCKAHGTENPQVSCR